MLLQNASGYLVKLEVAEIDEVSPELAAVEMVREVLNDFQMLLSFMVDASESAQDVGDIGTVDIINKMIINLEKSHWMFSAWLNQGKQDIKSKIVNS